MRVRQDMLSVLCAILFMFSGVSSAQAARSGDSVFAVQLRFADSLLQSGNPFDAVTEYERVVFFDKQHTHTRRALLGQTEAYLQGGKYTPAIDCMNRALAYSKSSAEIQDLQFALVKAHILNKNSGQAYGILDAMAQNRQNLSLLPALNYWYGWAKMFDDDWKSAADYFDKCDSANFLKKFCLDVDNKKYPVSFIKFISVVLPGSGSIYTGHYFSGALSLGWNALFGYLTVQALQNQRVLDALLIGDLLLLRFYTGNIENAEKYALEKNKEIHESALHYLETDFQGAKP
ncbi:MAG: tetratricopeptide repeat protein [Ignavibacteriales bacterium]|nr:tetratricopeptide repeat protein [Ignavibacteriales bacterium]